VSVLSYLQAQVEEATDDEYRRKCQQACDDYAAALDKINAAEAIKNSVPVTPSV
jgi:hypothetical protein